MESLNCKIESFIRVIEEKIFCKCSLKVDVIISEESFEEIESFLKRKGKCEDEEIREKLRSDLLRYVRLIRFGGKRTKHKGVYLTSLEESREKLKGRLGKELYEECDRVLKNVKDRVDESLIINSLVKAHEYSGRRSKSAGLVVLLTTDGELSEKVASVASMIGLRNHIISPNPQDINECLSVDCYMGCILERILRGYAEWLPTLCVSGVAIGYH
jgi:hypothetical protein